MVRQIAIFNFQRGDFCCTLFASLTLFCAAFLLAAWLPVETSDRDSAVNVVIFISSLGSAVLLIFAFLKLICGYGDVCTADEYEQAEEEISILTPTTPNRSSWNDEVLFAQAVPEVLPKPEAPAKSVNPAVPDLQFLYQADELASIPGSRASEKDFTRKHRTWDIQRDAYDMTGDRKSIRDTIVEAGLVLEPIKQSIQMNGEVFPAGTFCVSDIKKGSPCERQGTCRVGDLVLSVNSKRLVEGTPVDEVHHLLVGKVGTSILIQIFPKDSMTYLTRHVILSQSSSFSR
mmetsp:Transcript_33490/g.105489  ORF Transcript_33490/g.105489 Transcript_33490/m.105489 type:complete len:288 (-) Transcript_33490:174-1037(-)